MPNPIVPYVLGLSVPRGTGPYPLEILEQVFEAASKLPRRRLQIIDFVKLSI